MGVKERREREREDVRARIFAAARELFAEHGPDGVTMRKLAQKIEYTATAVYSYFRDKETLLRELCDADFLALRKAFGKLDAVADPVERLRRLGEVYFEFAVEHPQHYRLLFMTPHAHDEVAESSIRPGDPDQDAYAYLRATVERAIDAGVFRPEYRDPDLVAQLLWASIHGVIALHLTHGSDPWVNWRPLHERAKAMNDLNLRGLMAADPAPPVGKK